MSKRTYIKCVICGVNHHKLFTLKNFMRLVMCVDLNFSVALFKNWTFHVLSKTDEEIGFSVFEDFVSFWTVWFVGWCGFGVGVFLFVVGVFVMFVCALGLRLAGSC
jgi:hypothetical protein